MDREGPAGREREWQRFVEAERAALENRRRGQPAKLLGGALTGKRRKELERQAREDRSRAELGLVELRDDDGVYYKHADDLTTEDLRARAMAEEDRKTWLTGRPRKLTGDRPRRGGRPSPAADEL